MASTKASIAAQKYSDYDILKFMREFLDNNDQMPPYFTIARHFGVSPNSITLRLHRLEREGFLARNEVNKIMFFRL